MNDLNEALLPLPLSPHDASGETSEGILVTQSRYFSPAFNAAIFDGPIRIYFAQYQESQALKLYFNLQNRFGDVRKQARGIFKNRSQNIFVMLYPSAEVFNLSFDTGQIKSRGGMLEIARGQFGNDFVIGVNGPLEDDALDILCREMDDIVCGASIV
jgi:hypothetical protein